MSSPSLLPELSRRSTSDTNATTQRVPAVTRNWRLPANHRRIDYSAEQNWLILPSRDHNGKAGNRRVRVADGAPPLPTTSSASFPRANSGTVADAAVAATAESDIDIDIDDIQVDGNVVVQPNDGSASEADVFFLHHTTYFVGLTPNIAIQKERKDFGIARCIKLFMSAFGHCRLYAPAYRQARIDMYVRRRTRRTSFRRRALTPPPHSFRRQGICVANEATWHSILRTRTAVMRSCTTSITSIRAGRSSSRATAKARCMPHGSCSISLTDLQQPRPPCRRAPYYRLALIRVPHRRRHHRQSLTRVRLNAH